MKLQRRAHRTSPDRAVLLPRHAIIPSTYHVSPIRCGESPARRRESATAISNVFIPSLLWLKMFSISVAKFSPPFKSNGGRDPLISSAMMRSTIFIRKRLRKMQPLFKHFLSICTVLWFAFAKFSFNYWPYLYFFHTSKMFWKIDKIESINRVLHRCIFGVFAGSSWNSHQYHYIWSWKTVEAVMSISVQTHTQFFSFKYNDKN